MSTNQLVKHVIANVLDEKWPEHLHKSKRFPGIPNLGVTCFANCKLQVMNHTPAFLNHFRNLRCDCQQVKDRKKAKIELQKQLSEQQQGWQKQTKKKGRRKYNKLVAES